MSRSTLTFLTLALAASAALAQTSPTTSLPSPISATGITPQQMTPSPLARFDDLDRNRDGFVARTEVPVTHDIARAWTILDENLDSRLSPEEFVAYNPEEGVD